MSSISAEQRKEASKMIQIVLYEEVEYASMIPLRLVDLYFIDQGRPDFVLDDKFRFDDFNPTHRPALEFQLESICRRLSSRCMGLIEYSLPPSYTSSSSSLDNDNDNDSPLHALKSTVDFLHRSCRDFLTTSSVLTDLHADTNGPYDAWIFLLNARISQFISLASHGGATADVLGLASHILCSLARPSYRHTAASAALASKIQPTLDAILAPPLPTRLGSYRYIHDAIHDWHTEHGTFLSLAIDFHLDAYTAAHLTRTRIATKRGRPFLDSLLRPRFAGLFESEPDDALIKNASLVTLALRNGADPNARYGDSSVWARFLCFVADVADVAAAPECSEVLEELIRAGAAVAAIVVAGEKHQLACVWRRGRRSERGGHGGV